MPTKGRKLSKAKKRLNARVAAGTWDDSSGRRKPGSMNRHKSYTLKGK